MAGRSVPTPASAKANAERFQNPTQNWFAVSVQKALYFLAAAQDLWSMESLYLNHVFNVIHCSIQHCIKLGRAKARQLI